MDALPFADSQVDIVVYNASLHYSTDYVRTPARRCVYCGRVDGS
jgi:hypothetical protein